MLFKDDRRRSDEWWTSKMREAKRNGLEACRVGAGRRKRGGSLWRPKLIAHWLTEKVNRTGFSARSIAAALKRVPGCESIAKEYLEEVEGPLQ